MRQATSMTFRPSPSRSLLMEAKRAKWLLARTVCIHRFGAAQYKKPVKVIDIVRAAQAGGFKVEVKLTPREEEEQP